MIPDLGFRFHRGIGRIAFVRRSAGGWRRTYEADVFSSHVEGAGLIRRLRIRRIDGREIRCSWSVIQRIKSEVLGEDVACVEVFPRADELVYDAECRHLWEVPAGWVPDLRRGGAP